MILQIAGIALATRSCNANLFTFKENWCKHDFDRSMVDVACFFAIGGGDFSS